MYSKIKNAIFTKGNIEGKQSTNHTTKGGRVQIIHAFNRELS